MNVGSGFRMAQFGKSSIYQNPNPAAQPLFRISRAAEGWPPAKSLSAPRQEKGADISRTVLLVPSLWGEAAQHSILDVLPAHDHRSQRDGFLSVRGLCNISFEQHDRTEHPDFDSAAVNVWVSRKCSLDRCNGCRRTVTLRTALFMIVGTEPQSLLLSALNG